MLTCSLFFFFTVSHQYHLLSLENIVEEMSYLARNRPGEVFSRAGICYGERFVALWVFHNEYFSPPPDKAKRGTFLKLYCESLMTFLK